MKTLKDIEINDWLFQGAQGEESQTQIIVATNKLHPEGDFIRLTKPIVQSHELKQEAINIIKAIRTGHMISREIIPETMRGSYPKEHWNDEKFTIGMEYGAIAILMHFFNVTEEELK